MSLAILQHGLGLSTGLTVNRVALGAFFSISGYHKLFNRERHASLVETLRACGVPCLAFNQWWVPSVEFAGGLALLSGVLAPLAAVGLIVICSIACLTDGAKRIRSYSPIDAADYFDDVLYLPEALYTIGLVIVIVAGPGPFTLV